MNDVIPICFYLPQFHTTPFNDMNWGRGFTEWINVAKGKPRYPGHIQPKIPSELGFYDLRHRAVLGSQISLAQSHGIYGFCFYYYRFGKKRELELPVDSLLSRPSPELPFCLCWANESWTRAWDGRSSEVIHEQDYSDDTTMGLISDLSEAIQDPRYIRLNGKAVFLIYQLEKLPLPTGDWISAFREKIRARTGSDLLLGAVFSHGMNKELAKLVDFVVQFPPHRLPRKQKRVLVERSTVSPFEPALEDNYESYEAVVSASLSGVDMIDNLVPGVCPDWDNSVRRASGAHILVGSTPELFANWVSTATTIATQKARAGKIPEPLLFINAWNEWAEGATLEPNWSEGRAYLEALKKGLDAAKKK
jgi:lipopolysaccharide biosynthesis protein